MSEFQSKAIGWHAFLTGVAGLLAVVTLLLFFLDQFQDIASVSGMGGINDRLNIVVSVLSAILASVLYPTLHKLTGQMLSLALIIGAWLGASAVTFGSWLILTDRAGVELSSYYFFFGNGLIGIWLWTLNRVTQREGLWPLSLTRFGSIASAFMMLGLLGLYGLLLGMDGNDSSPLILVTGISFIGIGILYPIWCLWLGRLIASERAGKPVTVRGS